MLCNRTRNETMAPETPIPAAVQVASSTLRIHPTDADADADAGTSKTAQVPSEHAMHIHTWVHIVIVANADQPIASRCRIRCVRRAGYDDGSFT